MPRGNIIKAGDAIPEIQLSEPTLNLDRVLVVDDVALNREIFIMHLEPAVRHADEAGDGAAALALFKRHRYDAVLMDIEMPGVDGYCAMTGMRAWERERQVPQTPILAITSSDFPEDEQRIMAAGATAYLVKPVKQQDLMTALRLHQHSEPIPHPMAHLLPRMFSYATAMLDEAAALDDAEAISRSLHQLRGMIAVYGFTDFAESLRQVHSAVQQGRIPEAGSFARLRKELLRLEGEGRQ